MKVKSDAVELLNAIKAIQKALGAVSALTISAGKKLTLAASNEGKSVQITIANAEVSKEGSFTVTVEVLSGILKNRKEIVLEKEKETVHFKAPSSKNYSGKIVILPPVDVKVDSESTNIELKEDSIKLLDSMVSSVALADINLKAMNIIPICIKMGDKGIEISCAARNYFTYAKSSHKFKTKGEHVLGSEVIPTLNSLSSGEKYSLSITEASVFASNSVFKARVSLQQPEKFVTLENVKTMMDSIKKKKAEATAVFVKEELVTAVDNLLSIYEENSFITISISDGKIKVGTSTKFGNANDAIEATTKGKCKDKYSVHPKVFSNLLSRCKSSEITLGLFDKRLVYLSSEKDDIEYFFSCSSV